MSATPVIQLKIPESASELLSDPQRVKDAFVLLNVILAARVQITPAGTTRGTVSLVVTRSNMVIGIPLQFAAPIADATGAGDIVAQFNKVMAAMRVTGQNPTSV